MSNLQTITELAKASDLLGFADGLEAISNWGNRKLDRDGSAKKLIGEIVRGDLRGPELSMMLFAVRMRLNGNRRPLDALKSEFEDFHNRREKPADAYEEWQSIKKLASKIAPHLQ